MFQLFESLLQDLLIHKPDRPIDHLIKLLKRDAVPKIIVAGPPGAQARSVCELIAAKTELVHVIASDVWRELARLNSEPGLKAKALHDVGSEVPPELLLELPKEKLSMGECVSKGWILEGFPSTPTQARAMLSAGLLPTRFLHIALDDAEAVRRIAGRRVDPKENTVYHLEDHPPPDAATAQRLIQRADDAKERVAERLLAYRTEMAGVLPQFATVAVELDGSVAGEAGVSKLLEQALKHLTAEMPTRAPRGCPRVLLAGGPGTNAEALGAALAATYGAKLISAIDLLHGAALNGNHAAAKAMQAQQPLVAGEAVVGPLILERLAADDVRLAGFVLVGFHAAGFLKKHKVRRLEHTHARTRSHTLAHARTCSHTLAHARTRSTHPPTHAHTHTRTHAHTHTRTHAHIHLARSAVRRDASRTCRRSKSHEPSSDVFPRVHRCGCGMR